MKKQGHYCKVCQSYKANEKFSGKGHATHICKNCASANRQRLKMLKKSRAENEALKVKPKTLENTDISMK